MTKGRPLPHDLEAEESVLGSVMLSPDALLDVTAVLRPEDFYREAHRTMYAAVLTLAARGEPTDEVAVIAELRKAGAIEKAGGALGVHKCVESVPSPASAAHYARIVADTATLRRLIDAASGILEAAYARSDPVKVIEEAEAAVYGAARRRDADSVREIESLVSEVIDSLEQPVPPGVLTGFPDLDRKLGGLRPGQFVIVAARPGVGKSALVGNIARNVAATARVVVFSLEMSGVEITERLMAAEAGIPWERFRDRVIREDDWVSVARASETLSPRFLSIIDSGEVTTVDIRARARRMKASRGGLGLIVVDYIQLMRGVNRRDSREQEVAEISRSLKLLAKELEVPVLAVAQLNRDVEKRGSKVPRLADLRESGALEQDPDIVIFIHRDDDTPAPAVRTDLIIAKHRQGSTGGVPLTFRPALTQFVSYAEGRGA